MPTGSARAWRNLATASGNGDAEAGGPGGIRVRSVGKWAGILVVPLLTMNSWVCAITISPWSPSSFGRRFGERVTWQKPVAHHGLHNVRAFWYCTANGGLSNARLDHFRCDRRN